MLGAFTRAFRTPDLRNKLLFTLAVMGLFRVGSMVPTPGVDYSAVQACVAGQGQQDLLSLINLFSGGALLQLSVFALGIMPYITASIIVQLLRVVIPHFEALHKEGQSGTAKLTQYTRYLTIFLAILQATTFITMARTGVLFPGCTETVIPNESWANLLMMILIMTAGTGLIMWMGEQITEHGVGNGMSLLIFTSIAASFPGVIGTLIAGTNAASNVMWFVIMAALIIAAVVYVEQSQRRVPVQYAKRMVGRRMYGGSSTYIPIKINMSGVIPIIFASSILAMPGMLVQFSGDQQAPWVQWVAENLMSPSANTYIAVYALLLIFFTFFYTSITFNPDEVADNMKRYGGFIPGIRAGQPTADYLRFVVSRITTAGAIYLTIVALIPTFVFKLLNVADSIPFGGASLLIVVGVGLDTVRQIDSQLQQRHYEGFLR